MQEDLLVQIENKMSTFSKSQKLIANYIINSYEKAAYMTALKLGNAVNVSESTVVRFAIEMGFEGYPELQKSLQSLIKNRLTAVQRINITNDRIGDDGVLKNTLTQDMDRIRRTLEEIDPKAFDRAIEKICSARRIYILGAMSSSILARFLDYNFQLIFDNVHFVQAINTSGIYQQIIHMNSEDAFIAISFPRYSQSTIKATAYAKKCNANVVAKNRQRDIAARRLCERTAYSKERYGELCGFARCSAQPAQCDNRCGERKKQGQHRADLRQAGKAVGRKSGI